MRNALIVIGFVIGCRQPPQKPAEAPATAPAPSPQPAPIDKTPIVVDLTKFAAVGPLKDREGHHGYDDGESRMFYWSNGNAETKIKLPGAGDYEITIGAACTQALNEFAKFKLHVDGSAGAEVTLSSEDVKEYKVPAALSADEHTLGIEFTNDVYKENEYDRNLFIHGVKLVRVR